MKTGARIPSRGASHSTKGVKKGFNVTKNGCTGSFNTQTVNHSSVVDPTMSAKTVPGSTAINQHKRLAMTGHT